MKLGFFIISTKLSNACSVFTELKKKLTELIHNLQNLQDLVSLKKTFFIDKQELVLGTCKFN